MSLLIGIAAGIGAIAFYWLIGQVTKLALGIGAGYMPPLPSGEGSTVFSSIGKIWMIPIITTLGGLVSGLICCEEIFGPEGSTEKAEKVLHSSPSFVLRCNARGNYSL